MCSQRVLTIGWIALILIAGASLAQAQDITGTWSVTEVADERAFGDGYQRYDYPITISHQGAGYVVSTPVGTFNVTVNGNTFTWAPASFSIDGGTETVTSMSLTISGTSFSGTSSWTWTDGVESGSGTSIFSATKTSSGSVNIVGTWNVTERSDESAFGEGFWIYEYSITIAQQGSGHIVSTPEGTFNVTVSGNNFWWSPVSYPDGDGTTTITSMTLTISSDGTSFSGSSTWTWSDGVESGVGRSVFTATKADIVFYDPVGTWQVTEVANETEAGLGVNTYQYTITVYQQGNGYLVSTPVGVFNVVMNEDVMTWAPATFDEDGGKTTITQMSLRISARSDRFSGASVWTWTDGSERYAAASDFVAVKSSESSGTSGPDALVDKTSGSGSSGGCIIDTAQSSTTGTSYILLAVLALCAVAFRILPRATRTGLSR